MKHIERRDFLKKGLLALAFAGLVTHQSPRASLDQKGVPKISPSLSKELHEIYISWKLKYQQEPEEFLSLSGISSKTTLNKINEKTRLDFLQDNIIDVHGLILGKTEAALLAVLYSYNKA